MRLAAIRSGRHYHAALVREDQFGLLPPARYSVPGILEARASAAEVERDVLEWVAMHDVEFLPPVEKPDKIICVGINFPDHATEADSGEIPPYPSLFARFASSQVGHGLPLRAPHNSEKFDYEGELAVVIGQPGRDVKERDAGRLVGGYTCFAENSVRDFQAHSRQVTPGKNFQSSGAIGPWVTTPDEIEDPAAMQVITRLNGEEMQRAPVSTMIYSVPRVLSYISSFTTLLPGDIIAMGTPAGVGMKRTPPAWLKPGDVLEVEVTGVGVLRNPVVASPEPRPPHPTTTPHGTIG